MRTHCPSQPPCETKSKMIHQSARSCEVHWQSLGNTHPLLGFLATSLTLWTAQGIASISPDTGTSWQTLHSISKKLLSRDLRCKNELNTPTFCVCVRWEAKDNMVFTPQKHHRKILSQYLSILFYPLCGLGTCEIGEFRVVNLILKYLLWKSISSSGNSLCSFLPIWSLYLSVTS